MMPAPRAATPWNLPALLAGFAQSVPECPASGLAMDSRQVSPGGLFLACAGEHGHGLEHASEALRLGAVAVAYEPDRIWGPEQARAVTLGTVLIAVPGLGARAGEIAARFHGHPSRHMSVVGITGTNGKTSCSHYLAQALGADGGCGVIGTLGAGLYPALEDTGMTTPDPVSLHGLLAKLRDAGARHVAMEVSSHALAQNRVSEVAFDVAVFTNLTRDHLDYHRDQRAYGMAKRMLFELADLPVAVVNGDDSFGRVLLAGVAKASQVLAYGTSAQRVAPSQQFVRASQVRRSPSGIGFALESSWGRGTVSSGLLGGFNVHNLLAVIGVLLELGMPLAQVIERLRHVDTAPGRMERFGAAGQPLVVVDYAHTPDALAQALRALRPHCDGRLWCVFGCGGERDRGKRPLMGAVAERDADFSLVTDDNPRGEDGGRIIADILSGMGVPRDALVERDRRRAIHQAVDAATAHDVVLVAGKGHERFQLVGDLRIECCDRAVVADALAAARERSE